MLETQDLTKHFKEVKAVDSINLFIERGEIVGLLGPNGAGKTTAIAMIAALIPPTRGEVLLYGKSVIASPAPLRQILGMVPQQLALYPDLTARENLQFFGRLYGLKGKSLAVRVDEVLELVGLEAKAHRPVSTLSGGMQRRLNIGLALLHEPRFVIMDEPTVGIDPQSRHHILETVRRLNREKGMTVLYTSHYMEEAEQLCDRVAIMDRGEIIALDTPAGLIRGLESDSVVEFTAESEAEAAFHRLPGVKEVRRTGERQTGVVLLTDRLQETLSGLITWAGERGVVLKDLRTRTATLEDVFLQRTGKRLTQE
ncbi:MAG: ABC transporter ATP-binding protein [Planifilum fulgidum]